MDPRLHMFGSIALLGTTRRTPSLPEAEFSAGSLIRDLAEALDSSPEAAARMLLCGAGALAVCGRAGYLPARCDPLPDIPAPCPDEQHDILPEHIPVTDVFGEIFRSGRVRLQWEALSYLVRRNMVLPHSLLVSALIMGRGNPVLRPLLFRTVGARGLWLASLNADWRMFASSSGENPEEDAWDHGRPMQRQAFFLAVRTSDAARARELFEKDMASMEASERTALLGLFVHGLSPDDEDLLERLLFKDRSREVRKTAASLLSLLPGSRYVRRMGERISACMETFLSAPAPKTLSGLIRAAASLAGMTDKKEFIAPPEAYDKTWAGDLISEKSPNSQFGPRAGWLYQMAVALPLSWWTERTGRTPEALLALSEHSEWKKPLQMAWGDAQLRCSDADWARAMLKNMKKGDVWPSSSGQRLDGFALAGMLGREERENVWESMVSKDTLAELLEDIRRRQEMEYHMSKALADKALLALQRRLSSVGSRDYMLSSVIDELAMVLPSETLEKALQLVAEMPDHTLNNEISDRFSAIVRQRRTMDTYFS